MLEFEGRSACIWTGLTVNTDCFIVEARVSLEFPRVSRLQGPRLWGLYSLGQDICSVHFCGVGDCTDMWNYKECVGSPARCHVLSRKVSCLGTVEHPESGQANYRDVWDAFWWANEHRLG